MPKLSYGKAQRLKREKDIALLFQQGQSLHQPPVRLVFRAVAVQDSSVPPILSGVSAAKRTFKRAHDRNRIKRLLREAFRLQQTPFILQVPEAAQIHCFFIFTGKSLPTFEEVYQAVGQLLIKLAARLALEEAQNRHREKGSGA